MEYGKHIESINIYIYFRQLPFYHADRDEYCRHASSKRLVKCVYCLGSFSLHPQF